MVGRKNRLEGRKRVESLPLANVVRPGKTFHGGLLHVVLENLGEKELVTNNGNVKSKARHGCSDSYHVPVLPHDGNTYIRQLESPTVLGWQRLDGRQSSGETAEAGVIGSLIHGERFDGTGRNGDREASGDRIGSTRGIDQQKALIFVRTLKR